MLAPSLEYDWFQKTPYPLGTTAFLYYSRSPEKPRISGELRLRVTSRDDVASFESGSDLLLANGQAWSRSLYGISKFNIPLYEKLREERIITDDLHEVLSTLPPQNLRKAQLMYTLNDSFIIDFSSNRLYFFVITEQGVGRLNFINIFFDGRGRCSASPYTGAYTLDTPILIILMNS